MASSCNVRDRLRGMGTSWWQFEQDRIDRSDDIYCLMHDKTLRLGDIAHHGYAYRDETNVWVGAQPDRWGHRRTDRLDPRIAAAAYEEARLGHTERGLPFRELALAVVAMKGPLVRAVSIKPNHEARTKMKEFLTRIYAGSIEEPHPSEQERIDAANCAQQKACEDAGGPFATEEQMDGIDVADGHPRPCGDDQDDRQGSMDAQRADILRQYVAEWLVSKKAAVHEGRKQPIAGTRPQPA